ncbi:hypothetical protein GE21DRAFT_1323044 [Neurospora crassa]|nr:hypothetical protein GE21DRAFT_1323044 [Neurospora crassa]
MGAKIGRLIDEMHVRLLVPANYRLRGLYPGEKRLEEGEKGWGKNMDDLDRGWYWIIDVLTDNLNISKCLLEDNELNSTGRCTHPPDRFAGRPSAWWLSSSPHVFRSSLFMFEKEKGEKINRKTFDRTEIFAWTFIDPGSAISRHQRISCFRTRRHQHVVSLCPTAPPVIISCNQLIPNNELVKPTENRHRQPFCFFVFRQTIAE